MPATGQRTSYVQGDDGDIRAGYVARFRDNGDGTVIDLSTGLTWEKKDDTGGLHDVENRYVWSGDGQQETIWDWLDEVNAEGGSGFAGHNDWRIPNINELWSKRQVVEYSMFSLETPPIFMFW